MDERYNGSRPRGYVPHGDEGESYTQQFVRQMNEYSAMDGTDYFNNDVDFEFEQYPPQAGEPQGYQQMPQTRARREYIHPKRQQQARQPRRQAQRPPERVRRQRQSEQRQVRETAARRQPRQAQYKENGPVRDSGGGTARVENAEGTKKKSIVKRVVIIVLSVIFALFVIYNIMLVYFVSKVNSVETGKRDSSIQATMTDKNVKNILIIGCDTRDPNTKGRTDVMMVMSVNTEKKVITMTSLMRDMYLPLVGYYNDGTKMYNDEEPDGLYRSKLNAAYVFGGAELLMDTIKYNFGLEIDDYVYIDFSSFTAIADSVGGITVEVTDEEVEALNECTLEQNRLNGDPDTKDYLKKGGKVELNGNQTLSYARMRRVGNADFQRTQRQRIVMTKLIEKVKDVNIFKKLGFMKAVMSSLTTNMSKTDLFFYGYKAPFYLGYEIKELRLPADNEFEYGEHAGQSTLDVDIEKCRKRIKEAIFD